LNVKMEKLNDTMDSQDIIEEINDDESKVENISKEEPSPKNIRPNLTGIKRIREKELPKGAEIYQGKSTLSELGITKNDIKINKNIKQFFSSWAFMFRPSSEEFEDLKLLEEQKSLSIDEIYRLFYDKIPEMKIARVIPREQSALDDPQFGPKGTKKPGYMEIVVESALTQLIAPLDKWKLKMVFYLVDNRKNESDPLKYTLYRQYVVAAFNEETGKSFIAKSSQSGTNE